MIIVSRIADGSTHLSPLGVCSDIERDPGAGGSVGQPGAPPQRLHLQEWSGLEIENLSQLRGEFESKMSKLLPPIFRSPQSSSALSSSCEMSSHQSGANTSQKSKDIKRLRGISRAFNDQIGD